jgi:hypothetical protein
VNAIDLMDDAPGEPPNHVDLAVVDGTGEGAIRLGGR